MLEVSPAAGGEPVPIGRPMGGFVVRTHPISDDRFLPEVRMFPRSLLAPGHLPSCFAPDPESRCIDAVAHADAWLHCHGRGAGRFADDEAAAVVRLWARAKDTFGTQRLAHWKTTGIHTKFLGVVLYPDGRAAVAHTSVLFGLIELPGQDADPALLRGGESFTAAPRSADAMALCDALAARAHRNHFPARFGVLYDNHSRCVAAYSNNPYARMPPDFREREVDEVRRALADAGHQEVGVGWDALDGADIGCTYAVVARAAKKDCPQIQSIFDESRKKVWRAQTDLERGPSGEERTGNQVVTGDSAADVNA